MTFDDIITITLNRCGRVGDNSALNTAALLELGLIQTKLEEAPELPWFLLSESYAAETTSGEPRLQVPSDFLLEEEHSDLWLQDSDGDWAPLIKIEYDRLKNEYQNSDSGTPTHYALRGGYFYLGVTPNAIFNVRMTCYGQDDVPALGEENQWGKHAPDVLIAELGIIMAGQYLSDFKKLETFEKDLLRAQRRLDAKNIARDEVNQIAEMRG